VGRAFACGAAPSYGADDWTHRVEHRLRELFEKPDLVAFPVATGTAANVLSLACCTPSWGAIYCHPQAHIAVDEANAPEFFTSGAKLCLIDGPAGKIDPKKLAEALAQPVYGVVHHPQPAAVSITQATECGTVYAPEEIAALASSTHRHGLKLHMDGAQLLYPVDANEIFVVLPAHMHDELQAAGAQYHPWPSDRPGERAFRLVTAFDTNPKDIDRFLSIAKAA
jgi:threonine aldolase